MTNQANIGKNGSLEIVKLFREEAKYILNFANNGNCRGERLVDGREWLKLWYDKKTMGIVTVQGWARFWLRPPYRKKPPL